MLTLYDKHLAADGKSVDYKGLGTDPDFQLFVDATAELQKLDVSGFTRQERMAFWINMYNVLVVCFCQRSSADNNEQPWCAASLPQCAVAVLQSLSCPQPGSCCSGIVQVASA